MLESHAWNVKSAPCVARSIHSIGHLARASIQDLGDRFLHQSLADIAMTATSGQIRTCREDEVLSQTIVRVGLKAALTVDRMVHARTDHAPMRSGPIGQDLTADWTIVPAAKGADLMATDHDPKDRTLDHTENEVLRQNPDLRASDRVSVVDQRVRRARALPATETDVLMRTLERIAGQIARDRFSGTTWKWQYLRSPRLSRAIRTANSTDYASLAGISHDRRVPSSKPFRRCVFGRKSLEIKTLM